MKKSLFMTLLLGLCFSVSLSANPFPDGSIVARTKLVKEKTIALRLFNLKKQKTTVILTDVYEDDKYYEKVIRNHNGFAQQLNLRKLKDGNYLIKIKSGDAVQQQVIRIKNGEVLFSKFS